MSDDAEAEQGQAGAGNVADMAEFGATLEHVLAIRPKDCYTLGLAIAREICGSSISDEEFDRLQFALLKSVYEGDRTTIGTDAEGCTKWPYLHPRSVRDKCVDDRKAEFAATVLILFGQNMAQVLFGKENFPGEQLWPASKDVQDRRHSYAAGLLATTG